MDSKEVNGREKDKEKVNKRKNRLVLWRTLERRKTDTIVTEDTAKGDINLGTLVRRSQSDKTEYSAKIKEKLMPHEMSTPLSPILDPEEVRLRKMNRRANVIKELVQTEKDYLTDLELCIKEVVQPLRKMQVLDVDRLFTNMETVCEVSAELLQRLHDAMADPDPEAVVIGEVFIQAKAALEDVYKIYCYHHDDANMSLKAYEKDEQIKQHFIACVLALKKIYDREGKANLLDMGSLLIKPVQRIMKYPLLLGELWQATPEDHPDHQPLQEAFTTAKIINININEFRRRKDIVMKYKRLEDEGTLRGKLTKLNIHSIRKKGDRFAGYLKILTGVEPQVRDEVFDREEKLFRSLGKAVRQLVKNVHCYMQHTQEMVSVAVQNVKDMETVIKDPNKIDTNGSLHNNWNDPYKQFKDRMEKVVLVPLSALQGMFTAPQKLIQKRYDKLLDYCCRLERSSSSSATTSSMSAGSEDPADPARRDYEALNNLLVEELQRFNLAAHTILTNSVVCLVALLKELMGNAQVDAPSLQQLPPPLSNIIDVQNSIMDKLNNLTFVKDNAQRLMERKVSFERRERRPSVPEVEHQTEEQRALLLAEYPVSRLYQLKRKCNGCQEQDLSLLEGELVALLEDTDPLGSSSRWLVHTGGAQGYVYSTFLKQYNPQRDSQRAGQKAQEQPQQQPPAVADDDFDDLSLFVSGSGSSSLHSFKLNTTDSSSILSGLPGELEAADDLQDPPEAEAQQFYAVYAFQARCAQELTLQEYQHVRIIQFCDLGGNKEWWLAEANGQRGYVPANYLGKMSYA
ncbi:rho guanine nucleotide exchange factor 38 [Oryzias latipes]|uniref:rho guanine nucleotide exchange factor 38 n=1 Tax=Oryzias latipes TaxID=8090 RepID=UPI000CE21AF6|nr:rho guanine nucleotide exchange factor 38 [Oryzias latipes]